MPYLIVLLIFLLLLGSACYAGNYFFNLAVNAKTDKSRIWELPGAPTDEEAIRAAENEKANKDFLTQYPPEDLSITSRDKRHLRLHGMLFRQAQPSDKWAILVHGYTSEGTNMLREARAFYAQGYNLLLPDLRGHGKSEGDYIAMGWDDHFDILAWLEEVLYLAPGAQIALYGVSMGAATVMNVSGEPLPDNVKVIVEDCGYTNIAGIFIYQLKRLFGLPRFPLLYLADAATRLRAGYSILAPGPVDQVAKSKTPILFIHGDKDTFVPFSMHDLVYNAAACPKEKLVIPGAGHAAAERTDPERYWNVVWRFVGRYIG